MFKKDTRGYIKRHIGKPNKSSVRDIISVLIIIVGIALGFIVGLSIIISNVLDVANMIDANTFTCMKLVFNLAGMIAGYLVGRIICFVLSLTGIFIGSK